MPCQLRGCFCDTITISSFSIKTALPCLTVSSQRSDISNAGSSNPQSFNGFSIAEVSCTEKTMAPQAPHHPTWQNSVADHGRGLADVGISSGLD